MKKWIIAAFVALFCTLIIASAPTYLTDTVFIGGKTSTADKVVGFRTSGGIKSLFANYISGILGVDSDSFSVGDGTVTDKKIILDVGAGSNNPYIGYNSVTQKTVFNNGTSEKPLGSGSGGGSGGTNLITNFSFEDGDAIPGWTNSGGTFSLQDYINPSENNAKFSRFTSTTPGEYFEYEYVTVPSAFGPGCQFQIDKYALDTNEGFKVEVLDVSSNVLASTNLAITQETTLTDSNTVRKSPLLTFQCPEAGETFKVRVESLAAASIDADDFYQGNNRNIGNSQSINRQSSYYVNASSLSASTVLTGAQNESGGGYVYTYDSGTGVYRCLIECTLTLHYSSSAVANAGVIPEIVVDGIVRSSDGNIATAGSYANASYSGTHHKGTEFFFRAGGSNNSSNHKVSVSAIGISGGEVVTNEQASWFINANIGGANASLGTGNTASYTELTNGSLDLVLNDGSASAKIACASGNTSTGLTCSSSDESVGVTFTPPYNGWFEACFLVNHEGNAGSSGSIASIFQLGLTSDSSSTIIAHGNQRRQVKIFGNSIPGVALGSSIDVCSIFYFNSISEKTVRLFYEQSVGGIVNSSQVIGDRDASNGQRDLQVLIRPLLQETSRAILISENINYDGNEYLTGKKADGEYVYRRCWKNESDITETTTIATIQTGLNLTNWITGQTNIWWAPQSLINSGSDFVNIRYIGNTGVVQVEISGASYDYLSGNRFCMEYTKP